MDSDFEFILASVGSYGKFQKKLLLWVLNPVAFYVSLTASLVYFQLTVPEYWCHVPERDDSQFSILDWRNLTIPKKSDGSFEKCLTYQTKIHGETDSASFQLANKSEECVNGWEHDKSLFWETAATDKEWLCDKELFSTHVVSISIAGQAVGAFILPVLADIFTGRKLMLFIALGIHLLFNLVLLFWSQFYMMVVMKFLAGISIQVAYQMPYIITMEFLGPEHRTLAAFLSFMAWTAGMCCASLVAYLIPHWWYLILFSCIVTVPFFALWKFVPESPRWLLSKGNLEECTQILIEVAHTNGTHDIAVDKLKEKLLYLSQQAKVSKIPFKQVLKFRKLCKNASVLTLLAILSWITYGCVLLNMDVLPNSHFLNFFILSFIELPSNVLGWVSVDYLGRRMTSLLTFIAATIFSLLALTSRGDRLLLLCMVAFVKIFSTIGLYIVYLMAGEIFPTPIRSTGIGLVVVIATLFGMVSPYIIAAGEVFQYSLLIAVNVACIGLGLLLPETLGLPLPQTLQDANVLGQDRPFLKWIHYWNQTEMNPCNAKHNNVIQKDFELNMKNKSDPNKE